MNQAKTFFKNRHTTEESRTTTLKFLELQDRYDKENLVVYVGMDKEYVKKGAEKSFLSSTNMGNRDRLSLKKRIAKETLSPYGTDRTWII